MNGKNDTQDANADAAFAERSKALFEQSVAALDAQTLSRLNRSRQKALSTMDSTVIGFSRRTQWLPAAGVAAVALLAVTIWYTRVPTDEMEPAPIADLELLMAEDSFEMLQELEFYSWMNFDRESDAAAGSDSDVG